jgi:hypothetical protein
MRDSFGFTTTQVHTAIQVHLLRSMTEFWVGGGAPQKGTHPTVHATKVSACVCDAFTQYGTLPPT